ncbi:porin [Rugamonas aquatica]|uniref:Porin domain-containing protein n=1 Tax=Rugamonas aquatica TaxID=2743357 RepID=A0A6A7N2F0_9BURK|nr:porin [Rugamonas aquatica]MQA39172.1 hypothetical protein [Rugamonas aquatica]
MTVDFSPLRAARAALTFSLTMLACAMAQADDTAAAPLWTFGGYGTLGFVHSNDSQSDFTANVLNPGNAGASHEWSATVDSRLGMQLGLNLNSRWSAVLQVVSERTLQSGYAPTVEWANIKYQATPDLNLRVGRIALPLFLAGDYRKAGYALPWVRPPVELYGAIPISNSDGVDASYRWSAMGVHNVTQFFFGRTDIAVTPQAHATARAMTGLSNTTTSGALTVRASAMTTELTVNLARELFAGLSQFGPQGAALAARYDVNAKRADVVTLGASYDPGAWFLMGEVGRMNARSYLGDKTAAYFSAGYRYGDLTPYAGYAMSRSRTPARIDGLDLRGLPPQLAAAGAQLNGGLNQMLATIPHQRSINAGLRWDVRANYALKLQYDRLTPLRGSNGTFINVQPGFQSGHPISVVSASVDFVF